jgi:hypothetical protein
MRVGEVTRLNRRRRRTDTLLGAMDSPHGTVARLWRWPVKSMAGEPVGGLSVDARGAGGDRTHAVFHERRGVRKPLTAREAPRMLAWRAAYPVSVDGGLDPARPPVAVVTAPDGTSHRWGDPRLRSALEADLGRPVELGRDVQGIHDAPRTLLVTTEATLRGLGDELGGRVDPRVVEHVGPLDVARERVHDPRLGGPLRLGDRRRRLPVAEKRVVAALGVEVGWRRR